MTHSGTREGLCRSLSRLIRYKGTPTAFFISGAHETLTTVSWLAQKTLRMGVDYALISRNNDVFLSHLVPSVPCYRRDHEKFSVALVRLIQRILKEPNIPPTSVKVLPEFAPGKALELVNGSDRHQ
ncbi:substrate-binding domain-containing protein [Coraliomargarita parva]|uniref:substrate-binding domain-containing protein n=1 Tax=Coraliomargarita parva TaxID=3014050 RepID=UPI003CE5B092